jgi:hypothetical protein
VEEIVGEIERAAARRAQSLLTHARSPKSQNDSI